MAAVSLDLNGKTPFIYLYREPVANKQRIMTLGGYYGVDCDGGTVVRLRTVG